MSEAWSDSFPAEPGHYWLYGDLLFGSMGRDYEPDAKPDEEFHLVKILRMGDGGMMGTSEGQIIFRAKFDKGTRKPGWVGKWLPTVFPEPPQLQRGTNQNEGS